MTVAILLLGFFLLLLMGVPIAFGVGLAALGAIISAGIPVFVIFQRMFGGVDNFTLLAIPFFIFMGNIMERGGIADRIVGFANVLVGRVRGGLAAVNVLDSMFFAGISGSAVADVASIGAIIIPMMYKQGYEKGFSVALTCTTATIGLIIPPSNTMILYSFVAGGVSIADLFAAGFLPGFLVGIGLLIVVFVEARVHNYPRHVVPSFKEAVRITREAMMSLVIFIIIVGGIIIGFCTATEAAVFGVVYALLLTIYGYKEMKWKDLPRVMLNTIHTTAIVVFLIATSTAFSYVMTAERVPVVISNFLLSLTDNKYLLLLLINIMLLFVGMVMDQSPAILIFTPILLPIALKLGMSPVQFGLMLLVNLCIGGVTPPVGGVLFVGLGIGKITINQILRPLFLCILPMFIVVLLIAYVEPVTMVLPKILFGR